MGGQMSTSMVVDKGWVSFSFGFTFDKRVVGSLNSGYNSLKDMVRMNHGLSVKMSSLGSHNRGSVLRYNSSIRILNKTIGHMSSPMMNSVKMGWVGFSLSGHKGDK